VEDSVRIAQEAGLARRMLIGTLKVVAGQMALVTHRDKMGEKS